MNDKCLLRFFSSLSSISQFVSEVIEPFFSFVDNESIDLGDRDIRFDAFLKILSSFVEFNQDFISFHNKEQLNSVFFYSFIWSFVHPIYQKFVEIKVVLSTRLKLCSRNDKQIERYLREKSSFSFELSENKDRLIDLHPNLNVKSGSSSMFVPISVWLNIRQLKYDCLNELTGLVYLIHILMSNQTAMALFTEENGFGKTSLIKRILNSFPHVRLVSTGRRRDCLINELFHQHSSIIQHGKMSRERKFFVFVDDFDRRDSDLGRSWIDQNSPSKLDDLGWIFVGKQDYRSYPKCFVRQIVPLTINESLNTLISSIYSVQIRSWLEDFAVDAINHPVELSNAIVYTIEETVDYLRKNIKTIRWNLHQVESIVNGLFLLDGKVKRSNPNQSSNFRFSKKKQQDEQTGTIVRLLIHEICRTVLHRLSLDRGQIWSLLVDG